MAKYTAISIDTLRQVLHYDPDTGEFTHKERPLHMFKSSSRIPAESYCRSWNNKYSGKSAVCKTPGWYSCIVVFKTNIKAHIAAWAYVYGAWPDTEIDHKNNDKSDNRIENLRPATRRQQARNITRRETKRVPLKGVTVCTKTGKFLANIRTDGERLNLGRFLTPEEAHEAYKAAALKYHGEFAKF